MYVIATVTLENPEGVEEDYEVGASVTYDPGGNGWAPSYEVEEPDVSAPGSTLKESRLACDPQVPGNLPVGWSGMVEDALIEAYQERDADGIDPPDAWDDWDDYMYGED